MTKSIIAYNKDHLNLLIDEHISIYGPKCNLNHIDVSNVTDMSSLFQNSTFRGVISKWDVSNVTNMNSMFYRSQFNGDISKWNTSKVIDLSNMFGETSFKSDISKWNTSKVENMQFLFSGSSFNGDISKWDTHNVKDMTGLFKRSYFNGDISKWDTSNVLLMPEMFYYSDFQGDISKWNTSKVINMHEMFYGSKFNGDISNWKASENISSLNIIKKDFKQKLPLFILNSLPHFLDNYEIDCLLKLHKYECTDVHLKMALRDSLRANLIEPHLYQQICELKRICKGLGLSEDESVKYMKNNINSPKGLIINEFNYI